MNQEYMQIDEEKEVTYMDDCAYIHLDIDKDGGSWSLDDKCAGWMWYGANDDFLLGMMRVAHAKIDSQDFSEELKESGIDKEDIFNAIKKSLERNPYDGLYSVLGDNAMFMGWDLDGIEENVAEWKEEDMEYTHPNLSEEKIDDIIDEAWIYYNLPKEDEILKLASKDLEYIYEGTETAKYIEDNTTWRDLVMEVTIDCMENTSNSEDMMICINDKLKPPPTTKDGDIFFMNIYDFWKDLVTEQFDKAVDEAIKELAKKGKL